MALGSPWNPRVRFRVGRLPSRRPWDATHIPFPSKFQSLDFGKLLWRWANYTTLVRRYLLETPSELLSLCLEMQGVVFVSLCVFLFVWGTVYTNVQPSANKGPPTPVRNGLMRLVSRGVGQGRMDLLQFFIEKGQDDSHCEACSWRSRKLAVPI